MTIPLYPYQQAGVRFLTTAQSALLGDEMGTGKTIQTIATLERERAFPALIVCPNTVKSVWEREFAQWAPNVRVRIAASGTAAATKAAKDVLDNGADALVINWEALRNLSRLAPFGSVRLQSCQSCDPTSTRKPTQCEREDKILNEVAWAAVIADEAHRAVDPKAKQTRALWAVGDKADHRFALTGTPVVNSPEDMWSIMRFVAPDEYPAKWAWIDRYAKTVPNVFSGGVDVIGLREDRREELDKFFLPRFIRRTKAQVLPDLPPKTYERRDITLTGKQKKAYDQMAGAMIAAIDGGILVSSSVLTNALRLRQLASAYGELVSGKAETMTFDDIGKVFEDEAAHVRLTEPSSKLDALEEVLEEIGTERQVVVFADSRQLIDLAFARLSDKMTCGLITGPVASEERAIAVENFQAGRSRVMLATVGAGGEGITLTAADTAIYLQRPWSSVLNAQSEDRLHRIGQGAQNVTYVDLVAVDTIEEKVFDTLRDKKAKLEDVVQDADALRRWLE